MGEHGKSPGRPRSMNDARVTVRLPASLLHGYEEAAEVIGISFAELVRQMLVVGQPQVEMMIEAVRAFKEGQPLRGAAVMRGHLEEAKAKADGEMAEIERKVADGSMRGQAIGSKKRRPGRVAAGRQPAARRKREAG